MKKLAIALLCLAPLIAVNQAIPSGAQSKDERPSIKVTTTTRPKPPPTTTTTLPPWLTSAARVTSTKPAVRLNPPTTPPVPTGINGLPLAPENMSNCDEMQFYRIQAGLPAHFDAIGWRESNCRNEPSVKTWCCYGYWQIYWSLHADKLSELCGVGSAWDINGDEPLDKQRQACSAKVLFDEVGYQPWATTS